MGLFQGTIGFTCTFSYMPVLLLQGDFIAGLLHAFTTTRSDCAETEETISSLTNLFKPKLFLDLLCLQLSKITITEVCFFCFVLLLFVMLPRYNARPCTDAFSCESVLFYSCMQNGYCKSKA